MSLFPLLRQATNAAAAADESIIYLLLAACVGVIYTLGTEKYIRAMLHRHIYVRISMLFLSALCWLPVILEMHFFNNNLMLFSMRDAKRFVAVTKLLVHF